MFDLTPQSRKELQNHTSSLLEAYYENTKELSVSTEWEISEIRSFASALNLEKENDALGVISHVIEGLRKFAVQTPHPNYFGLFNPRPGFASIMGDYITATLNPQLAAWSHSPYANEIEYLIIQEFGKKFGYKFDTIEGTFCSGGAESNLTAVLCALNNRFPNYSKCGTKGIDKNPIIYCSTESHHSIEKAAKITGLGSEAVRSIPVNDHLQMDARILQEQIENDRNNDLTPLMVIGTAGTTGSGAIDNLSEIHKIALREILWFHVDAAYGGAIIVSDAHKKELTGIEFSDSLTLDLHKWFSVPMGSSLFLTNHKNILHQSFGVETEYMPEDGDKAKVRDGYVNSVQWSRRFIGLKFYLPLAIHGWKQYENVINQHVEMGRLLKNLLEEKGWTINNDSPLPVICFSHEDLQEKEMIAELVDLINGSGKAWISVYPINGKDTIRACITNYATTSVEVNELVELIDDRRQSVDLNSSTGVGLSADS